MCVRGGGHLGKSVVQTACAHPAPMHSRHHSRIDCVCTVHTRIHSPTSTPSRPWRTGCPGSSDVRHRSCVCTRIHTGIHTCTHTFTRAHTHEGHIRAHTHSSEVHIHIPVHAYTYTHTYGIHAYIYTRTCTQRVPLRGHGAHRMFRELRPLTCAGVRHGHTVHSHKPHFARAINSHATLLRTRTYTPL